MALNVALELIIFKVNVLRWMIVGCVTVTLLSPARLLIRLSQFLNKHLYKDSKQHILNIPHFGLTMVNKRLTSLIVFILNLSAITSFSISDQRDVGDLQNPARTDAGGRLCVNIYKSEH